MAGSVNKAIIVGNLGRDPEIRTMQNGDRVCDLSVATSESWIDKSSGERRERTEWHRVTIFNGNLVDVAERYLKKGAKVYIEGQIRTRKWQDNNGQDRYTTEIVLAQYRGELQMLDKADGVPKAQSPDDYGTASGSARGTSNDAASRMISGQSSPGARDIDDEIPF